MTNLMSRTSKKVIRIALLISAALLGLAAGWAAAPTSRDSDRMSELRNAWKARQDRFDNVRMKWTSKEWFAKGGISESLPKLSQGKGATVQPPQDVSFTVPYQLRIAGVKARADHSGWQWDTSEMRFNATKWACAFDGILTRECHLEREGEERWPRGSVTQKGAYAGARYGFLRAPFVFFRPLEPCHYGFDLSRFTISTVHAKVRGFDCWELQEPTLSGTFHLWIDPERDYLVVRQMSMAKGVPSLQIDYDYRPDAQWGWMLGGWQLTSMSRGGRITETSKVIVDELVVNESSSVGGIDLAFPPGALIADSVNRQHYFIRNNGTQRLLTREDLRLPYERLEESIRGEVRQANWLTTGLVLVAMACLGLFFYRRMRVRQSNSVGMRPGVMVS